MVPEAGGEPRRKYLSRKDLLEIRQGRRLRQFTNCLPGGKKQTKNGKWRMELEGSCLVGKNAVRELVGWGGEARGLSKKTLTMARKVDLQSFG